MSKFFESKNPLLKESAMDKSMSKTDGGFIGYADRMSVAGAVNKTFVLFAVMLVAAGISYYNPSQLNLIIGALGGLAVLLYTNWKPTKAPFTAPLYAALQGLFVGTISFIYGTQAGLDGIIGQAVLLTFGTLVSMLMIYKSGLIKVTHKFRMGVAMATGAIMLTYLVSWVMYFFGTSIPFLHDNGPLGIGISVVIIGVAAMNLLLDFDSFEKGEAGGAPKYIEWMCAMGLLFTLVWLYVEFLRLLSKLQSD